MAMGKAPPWPTSHNPGLSPQDLPLACRPCTGMGDRQALSVRAPARQPAPREGQHLHAVVVGAFPVEVAAVVVDAAVVQRAEAHEAVLQGVVPLLVHVVVPDHVLLAREPLVVALRVEAVVVLPVLVGAVDVAAVLTAREPAERREAQTPLAASPREDPSKGLGLSSRGSVPCPRSVPGFKGPWGLCGDVEGHMWPAGVQWQRP